MHASVVPVIGSKGGPSCASPVAVTVCAADEPKVRLIGWSALQLLTRAFYAAGDTRMPTIVNLGLTAVAIVLMAWWFSLSSGGDRVVVLGLAFIAFGADLVRHEPRV